jgi:hypothetical protein
MMKSRSIIPLSFAALLVVIVAAQGQQSPPGVLLNLTIQIAGNVTSTDRINLLPAPANLRCTLNQSSHQGSATLTYKIQALEEGLDTYYDLIESPVISSDNVPIPLYVGAGISSTPNVSANVPLPSGWRVVAVVGGTNTPTSAARIHCRIQ